MGAAEGEKAKIVSGILAARKSESRCIWWRPHVVTRANVKPLLCSQNCVQKPHPLAEAQVLLQECVMSCLVSMLAAQNSNIKSVFTYSTVKDNQLPLQSPFLDEMIEVLEWLVGCFPVNPSVSVLLQDLADDLSSELSGHFRSVVLGLLMLAPVYDAYELYTAMKVTVFLTYLY